ncbi:MAG: SipW-dependent-type signal peptide-containing protein [Dehalococcoidales bacterium]|nr:SipW-dependent-type signal peptide-containing protein [Dehalococcoidales bacterium]
MKIQSPATLKETEKSVKKIIALTIAFLLATGMAATGVWAYFTDTETTGAVITAGTLDLVPAVSGSGTAGKYTVAGGGNQANGNAVFTKILPGESGSITWVLVNNGSVPGTLTIDSAVTFSDVSQNIVENAVSGNNDGGNGDLDDCMSIKLQRGTGTDQANAEANLVYLLGSSGAGAALSGLEAVLNGQSVAMTASGGSDTVVYIITWSVATDIKRAGSDGSFGTGDDINVNENIIQTDSAQIGITFTLNSGN